MKTLSYLILFLLVAAPNLVRAQGAGKITGAVQDPDKKPIEAATVSLLKAQDSSLVKISLTDAAGAFELENLKPNTYLVLVNYLGYKLFYSAPLVIEVSNNLALPTVILSQDGAQVLQEVTIASQKLFVEQKIDRTVVNVGALLSNAGTSALEVLEKSPGVLVGENGAISLKGKSGVVVFIDDKPTYLAGADLESYLRSLPSETLETIEIMTNPPAKYEAAGNAGVINIKTKKNNTKSFNGNVNLSYGRGRYGKASNSLNLNYRNNKINLFSTFSQTANRGFSDLNIERRYKNNDQTLNASFSQNSDIVRTSESWAVKLGLDYYLTQSTTLGVVFNGLTRPTDVQTDNISELRKANGQLDSTIVADNRNSNSFKNGSVNLNLRHSFGKTGRTLGADADYVAYRTDAEQLYKNFVYYPDGDLRSQDQIAGALPSDINIYTAKVDYSHPLKNGLNVEAGGKTSYIKTNNVARYLTTENGVTAPDYDLSNHFKYRENINALYANMNKEFGRWSVQAGARLENTVIKGHQLGNIQKKDSSFSRSYTNVFPTVYVQHKLDSAGMKSITLSYGKRIDRPFFQDLNPFLSPLDKVTYYAGNPFLQPTFSHNLEMSYTHNLITASVRYSKSYDLINETIEIKDDAEVGKRYYSRPGNIGESESKVISLNATVNPQKWLRSTLYTEFSHNQFKSQLYDKQLDAGGNFLYASLNNQLTFKKGWSAEVNGLYRSKLFYAQFELGSYWQVGAGVQKRLFQDKGTLRVNVSDIFYSRVNKGVINNLTNTDAWWTNLGDTRVVTVSYSYRFGKTTSQRRQDTSGSESERNRVRE
ncbi:TonB-dependent receptor domain-containing protein [Rufibacter sp. LB8]|uniref:TonB-dependent receptor domain-containing protein n=1 Tax=Rufibacter sp. LB8 TaxID=2777781 RepID=UPI00178C1CD1|nr:TonB-dependent receptor [Rufibacter sp. LB8]